MNPPPSALDLHDQVPFLCACGQTYAVRRWFWVDADNDADLARRLRTEGPYEGTCPECGTAASGRAPICELAPSRDEAILWIPAERRGEVVDSLTAHLARVREAAHVVQTWMLRPKPAILEVEEQTGRYEMPGSRERDGVPQIIGPDTRPGMADPPPGLGGWLGSLVLDGEVVRVEVELDADILEAWSKADLEVRPIHLPTHGYPLVGVRVVGSFEGRRGCIDAVLDVGAPVAGEVFRVLADRFLVHVYLYAGAGEGTERAVSGDGLERNAALCLESARAALASGEYPPTAFDGAVAHLRGTDSETRLRPEEPTLRSGSYRHLVGAREIMGALAHLEEISTREVLSRILEVDGLPFSEFDLTRRRVLQASLDAGLCAPRRFWRRIVASGMVSDFEAYANQLARNRAEVGSDDDLSEEQRVMAWQNIWEFCERKSLIPPPELREALGLPEPEEDADERNRARASAAGTIGGAATPDTAVRFHEMLQNPGERLQAAAELLGGKVDDRSLAMVLDVLEDLETDELLAVLPDLSELGSRVVPGLVAKLRSEVQEVRQSAVIVLGLSRATDALPGLVEHLLWEPSTVWLDTARALGAYGARALPAVVDRLKLNPDEEELGRLSRALAEICVSEEDPTGRAEVEKMSETAETPAVVTASRRALATLRDVTESGAQVRGELPLPEVTQVRGFARRAYEAIMLPELEIMDELEVDG